MSELSAGHFYVVMLHHSLEHMLNQDVAFKEIMCLLAPVGTCLIRVPVTDSDPWERFGVNWVELDPPRYIVLHSRDSINILAERNGLEVVRVVDDSTAFAYWASELYQRGISLIDPETGTVRDPTELCSVNHLSECDTLAGLTNDADRGGRSAIPTAQGIGSTP